MKFLVKPIIGVIAFFSIIAIIIIIISFAINERVLLSASWGIDIPKANTEEVIYSSFGFQDGEELQIWQYDEEKKQKIIENHKFKPMRQQEIEFIKREIDDYYSMLSNEDKKLFDNNIELSSLLSDNNYFSYVKKDDNSWVMLILECETNKIYYLTDIS